VLLPSLRSLSFFVLAAALGCGPPTVDLPGGNSQTTSDRDGGGQGALTPPSIQPVPARYPHARLSIRGVAAGASRVLVEGAGNPVVAPVQPIDGSFCVTVELAAIPAHYTLDVRSQGGDGRLSEAAIVKVERARDATVAPGTELCDGSPPGG
jgi:hypothetical protein